jgi:hypothetical protein
MFVILAPVALAKAPPPAALSFTPQTGAAFDYGTLAVGGHAFQSFTLANGSGNSTALEVSLTGSLNFAMTYDGCSGIKLANGRTCLVIVRYNAATAGGDIGTLKARGTGKNAQAAPTSVSLNGSGLGTAHLYWSSYQDGLIRKANLDGSNVQVIVSDSNIANGMAVGNGRLYWTGFDEWGGPTIRSANLDGSDEATIITGQNCAWNLTADATHLYWSTICDGALHRANLDGSNPVTLVSNINISGVAVNSGHVYWAGSGGVYRANLDGTGVQNVYSLYAPCSVAADESHLYIGECNGNPLIRADLDGSNAFYFPGVAAESLRFTGGRIYWAANGDGIAVADPDGSNYQGSLIGGGNGVNSMTVGGQ